MLKFFSGFLIGASAGLYAATTYATEIKNFGEWIAASSLGSLF